jgi:hypothetical protein
MGLIFVGHLFTQNTMTLIEYRAILSIHKVYFVSFIVYSQGGLSYTKKGLDEFDEDDAKRALSFNIFVRGCPFW